MDLRRYHETLRLLREDYAPLLPVRVARRRMPPLLYGLAELWDGPTGELYFRVSISDRLPGWFLPHALIHEWAHCLSWTNARTMCDHDPEWAVAYGRLYQEVIDR